MTKDFYMLYQKDRKMDRHLVKCKDVQADNLPPIRLPLQIVNGYEPHVPAVSIPLQSLYEDDGFPLHLPGGRMKYGPPFPTTPAMRELCRLEHLFYLYDELHEYEIPGQPADRILFS